MGSYTGVQQFYLIDDGDLVNVDQDLNYNVLRADMRVRPLVEYAYTGVASVSDSSLPKETGFKYYKSYSNAIWYSKDNTGNIYQDGNAFVPAWNNSSFGFMNGYGNFNQADAQVGVAVYNGFARLRGKVMLNDHAEIPSNTTTQFLNPNFAFPFPSRSKYFFVHGGNGASSNPQVYRIFIPASGNLEFIKYGGTSAATSERYFSLDDCYWPVTDS